MENEVQRTYLHPSCIQHCCFHHRNSCPLANLEIHKRLEKAKGLVKVRGLVGVEKDYFHSYPCWLESSLKQQCSWRKLQGNQQQRIHIPN